ncbi:MAG: flagellar export chaperone FliS [Acidobacteria bacterium]|nr:flagellar export chaperone FliS [Acidobacteriota bacterium]
MSYNPYENYLENQILSASSLQLVTILYRAAIDALDGARRHLASGDIRSRASSSSRAQEIIGELATAVNRDAGELSVRLLELYEYVLRRVHEGNMKSNDAAYVEAIQLMNTLLDGWQTAQQALEQPGSGSYGEAAQQRESIECSF